MSRIEREILDEIADLQDEITKLKSISSSPETEQQIEILTKELEDAKGVYSLATITDSFGV